MIIKHPLLIECEDQKVIEFYGVNSGERIIWQNNEFDIEPRYIRGFERVLQCNASLAQLRVNLLSLIRLPGKLLTEPGVVLTQVQELMKRGTWGVVKIIAEENQEFDVTESFYKLNFIVRQLHEQKNVNYGAIIGYLEVSTAHFPDSVIKKDQNSFYSIEMIARCSTHDSNYHDFLKKVIESSQVKTVWIDVSDANDIAILVSSMTCRKLTDAKKHLVLDFANYDYSNENRVAISSFLAAVYKKPEIANNVSIWPLALERLTLRPKLGNIGGMYRLTLRGLPEEINKTDNSNCILCPLVAICGGSSSKTSFCAFKEVFIKFHEFISGVELKLKEQN